MSALIPALIDLLFPGVFPLGRGGRGGGGGGGAGRGSKGREPKDPNAAAEKAAARSLANAADNQIPDIPKASSPLQAGREKVERAARMLDGLMRDGSD